MAAVQQVAAVPAAGAPRLPAHLRWSCTALVLYCICGEGCSGSACPAAGGQPGLAASTAVRACCSTPVPVREISRRHPPCQPASPAAASIPSHSRLCCCPSLQPGGPPGIRPGFGPPPFPRPGFGPPPFPRPGFGPPPFPRPGFGPPPFPRPGMPPPGMGPPGMPPHGMPPHGMPPHGMAPGGGGKPWAACMHPQRTTPEAHAC